MSQSRDQLTSRFESKEYRHDYTESFFDTLIASQIRALRKRYGWKQAELGRRTGTTQSGISAFESSDYSKWSVATLRRFARAFDVALEVRFVDFADALKRADEFGRQMVFVVPYGEPADSAVPGIRDGAQAQVTLPSHAYYIGRGSQRTPDESTTPTVETSFVA